VRFGQSLHPVSHLAVCAIEGTNSDAAENGAFVHRLQPTLMHPVILGGFSPDLTYLVSSDQ